MRPFYLKIPFAIRGNSYYKAVAFIARFLKKLPAYLEQEHLKSKIINIQPFCFNPHNTVVYVVIECKEEKFLKPLYDELYDFYKKEANNFEEKGEKMDDLAKEDVMYLFKNVSYFMCENAEDYLYSRHRD